MHERYPHHINGFFCQFYDVTQVAIVHKYIKQFWQWAQLC
jgi:hypothetical protein